MMNLLYLFIFLIVMCTTAKADNIPGTQLFINVIKPLDIPVFKLMPLTGWGEISFSSSEQEADNIILDGVFSQGMILAKYSKKVSLQTYAALHYTKDSEKFDWNNKARLGVGIKLNYIFNDKFAIDVGAEYQWDYRPETERTLKDLEVFGNWFGEWSLDSLSNYPGYTWGGVSASNKDDIELSGAIVQGVDWYSFGTVIVNSFARFAYTLEAEDHWSNSDITYGIGSQLKISVADMPTTKVGFQLDQEKILKSGSIENQVSFFANWYF